MPAKKGFSERAWDEIINGDMTGSWIEGAIKEAKARPDDPFADTGPLLEAILKKGITKEQLCRLARAIRYETVFETVQLAAEEGLDADQLDGVHEELLTSDPSGKDGRPGSWPIEPAPLTKAARIAMETKAAAPAAARPKRGKRQDEPDAPLLKLPKGGDFAFSGDSSRLWLTHTSINASTVRGIDMPGGAQFVEFNSLPNLRGVAVSPDGKFIAASNHGGAVALHDAGSGKEIWKTPKTNQETRSLAYAPDGSMILISGTESRVRRHDAKTGKELTPLELGEGWLASDLAFAPGGETLALLAVKIPGAAHVVYWDWRAGKERARHPLPRGVSSLQYLPDGSGILIVSMKEVSILDPDSNERRAGFDADSVKGVRVHPSGRLLALDTFADSEIRELPSGKLLKKLDTKNMYPEHFAFSPDGRHLLLVASPKSFVWEVKALLGEH